MKQKSIIIALWETMNKQNWRELKGYFCSDATIFWNNTNEKFSVSEFIRVNNSYPGSWEIKVERIEKIENLVISVVKVKLIDGEESFHAVSFFEFEGEKIKILNEYWGEDDEPPKWRLDKRIGQRIQYNENSQWCNYQ